MRALRVLVTNDDGIRSEGLRQLALVPARLGLETCVAAPSHDSSGASASLAAVEADGRVLTERHELAGLDGVPAYAVAGGPAFITLSALRGAFGPPPQLVLSGINRGANTGRSVLHSGTVGAAFTARAHGCRAMAVSLAGSRSAHWETAAEVAAALVPWLVEQVDVGVLNLNVPDVPAPELKGLRPASLASFGVVQAQIATAGEGFVQVTVAEPPPDHQKGSDAALVQDGFATLTALEPLCEREHEPPSWRTGPQPVGPW